MNTALVLFLVVVSVALVVRRLSANHARTAGAPWGPGADAPWLDRDAQRARSDVVAAATRASSMATGEETSAGSSVVPHDRSRRRLLRVRSGRDAGAAAA